MKRFISILLSVVLVLSMCGLTAGATTTETGNTVEFDGKVYNLDNEYPWIFVHGMGGWGPYSGGSNEEMPYWGGWGDSEGDIIKMYNELGVEAYAATVGPFNSAWDRACEIYAQLTGTVVDYGAAHSAEHNHDRYGYDYSDRILMGEPWDCETPLNLVGHSFGGPAVRLFASLMAYGDEAEIAATGEDTSPLFTGGHEKSIHAVIGFSSVNNGSPIANLIYDSKPIMILLGFIANLAGMLFGREVMMWDLQMGHLGLTAKEDESRAKISLTAIKNFAYGKDNCGYDMTLRGAAELNERIKLSPYTYYYSYTTLVSEKTVFNTYVPVLSTFMMFFPTSTYLGTLEGRTIDGIYMDESWALNDGIVPHASAIYPSNNADTALSYSAEKAAGNEIEPGRWYYMDPMVGMDHFDFCGTIDYPTSFEDFYYTLVETINGR